MYLEDCDECSCIDQVGNICIELSKGKRVFIREDGQKIELLNKTILPFGMGTNWTITEYNGLYTFTLFDFFDVGFRFVLKSDELEGFGNYLLYCCEYMLQHGEAI